MVDRGIAKRKRLSEISALPRGMGLKNGKRVVEQPVSVDRAARPLLNSIFERLKRLVSEPRRTRMPFFFIVCNEQRKEVSSIVREFLRQHPPSPESEDGFIEESRPVVYVELPEKPSEGDFYNCMLMDAAVPVRTGDTISKRRYLVSSHLGCLGTRMLIINNFHYAPKSQRFVRDALLSAVKSINRRLRIPIVLIGDETMIDSTDDGFWISSDYLPVFLP